MEATDVLAASITTSTLTLAALTEARISAASMPGSMDARLILNASRSKEDMSPETVKSMLTVCTSRSPGCRGGDGGGGDGDGGGGDGGGGDDDGGGEGSGGGDGDAGGGGDGDGGGGDGDGRGGSGDGGGGDGDGGGGDGGGDGAALVAAYTYISVTKRKPDAPVRLRVTKVPEPPPPQLTKTGPCPVVGALTGPAHLCALDDETSPNEVPTQISKGESIAW